MFSPTEPDRERLEVLHEQLHELRNDCSCGPEGACDECGGEGITEDFYVYHHDSDSLQLGIRLTDISTKSELARRMNADTRFAVLARQINDLAESSEDVAEIIEAATLIGKMRYGVRGEDASKAWIDAHHDLMTPDEGKD